MSTPAASHGGPVAIGALPGGRSPRAAVATVSPLATEAGIAVLREGGNAIDAAVAAAWAIAVCEPSASGIGGHTAMLVRFADGRATVIEGPTRAPAAASIHTIPGAAQEWGYRSCAIPSTPATLDWAQCAHGALRRDRVMAPAIRIAEEGYRFTLLQHLHARWALDALRASCGGQLFLRHDDAPQPGDVMRQPRLAATLSRLRDRGCAEFYGGAMAREIADDMREGGGLITGADLATCPRPREAEPLSTMYGEYTVLATRPPSGGLDLLLALNVVSEVRGSGIEPGSDAWRECIALATSAVLRDRERRGERSTDLDPNVQEEVLDPAYARAIAGRLADAVREESRAGEPEEVTHVCACDREGNIVLLAQSIQSVYGARVAHPELGFLYNNYLSNCPRTAHAHALRPHCRPRSNITSTLVLRRDGGSLRPVLALGAAGSRCILSSVLQVVSAVFDERRTLAQALAAPRVHGLAGRSVWIERSAASPDLDQRLRAHGREPVLKPDLDFTMCAIQALQFAGDGGVAGAIDPRRDGDSRILQ